MTHPMSDSLHRQIRYLRISVTDRCNLRCRYCMPAEGVTPIQHDDVLRLEEIVRLVQVATSLGISQFRLTGGEPLARKGIIDLVRMISESPGVEGLSMTTNATMLAPVAQRLANAGLQRVNISLDTLDAARFSNITRCGRLEDAMAGIEAAHAAGLEPVKINTVVMRGINDDEVVDLARRTLTHGWHVRFIEVMPLGESAWLNRAHYVSSEETQAHIEQALGAMLPGKLAGSGPARYWKLDGAEGTIGFISAISEHFCEQCNRLRLTSEGALVPCLFSDTEFSLRDPLRAGADEETLRAVFQQAITCKPEGHHMAPGHTETNTQHAMSHIGG